MHPSSLLLVGCGKMGSALLARWQQTHPSGLHRFYVIEPMHRQTSSDHVRWFTSLDTLPEDYVPSVVVFAIKPQQMDATLASYRERFREHHPLYISIAAGKTLRYLVSHLGERAAIVRAMPNTPAAIGKGMTTLVADSHLQAALKQLATQLMEAAGDVIWLESETQMDAATAISGSGPAYSFLFMECLVKAGMQAGLSEPMARHLAIGTLLGSAELARSSSESLDELRRNVTSPGGTTEAALAILMENDALETLIKQAVDRAISRTKSL
ncbi:MAG: pyrroline-5-carboxylate reductase [Rickettsiales bacterium]|nr:pyrroline-5-carboxylate reductase [Rickettsiales bacterium]